MQIGAAAVVLVFGLCAGANDAATNLANEGDRERTTNIDGAIEKYEKAIELAPRDHRILHRLALAHMKKENWAAVEKDAARASELAPKRADYVFLHGLALARMSEWSRAKESLAKAAALAPANADAWFELAEAELRLEQQKLALTHYTRAVQAKPDDVSFYAALADLYIRLGFATEAEKTLKAGLALVPDAKKFALFMLHGQLLEERGDVAGSVTAYESAKKTCGDCGGSENIVYFSLGAAYASQKPPRKSEAAAQLTTFLKRVCKGAAAQRYADQCAQAQALMTQLGSP